MPERLPADEQRVTTHETDNAESELRKQKLELETLALRQQLRWRLELFKAFTVPVAIVGLVVTFFLGVSQLQEARRSRDDERFDRAVARLAGSTATERLSGVAGLGLYLQPQQKARHRATLRFLVNALAVEPDPTVRGELLDRLSQLTPIEVSQNDLNDALERLRDRNRSLYARQRSTFVEKLTQGSALPTDKGNDETFIGQASEADLAPLRATAAAITALVRNGAKTKDLSNIYCRACDFTGKVWEMLNPDFAKVADFAHADEANTLDLSGTDFHGAILRDSNFIGVNLKGASFDSADLIHVNFAGANLAGAKFTDYSHKEYFTTSMVMTGYSYLAPFPDFTCADLSNADFTGSVFFGIYIDGPIVLSASYPILHRANLANAKLGQMRVFTASPVPPNYNPTPPQQMNSFLFDGSAQVGSIQNLKNSRGEPIIVNVFWGLPSLRIKEPVPSDYWPSVRQVFSDLVSARNLEKSELPQGLKDFISRNQKSFSDSPHPTPCTPKT